MIDCLPAPCQGAIVAEALPENELAVEVLNKINDLQLNVICTEEKESDINTGAAVSRNLEFRVL